MYETKEIIGTLSINGNQESFKLVLPEDLAGNLMSTYTKAQVSLSAKVGTDEWYIYFDKWLHDSYPDIYDKVMTFFLKEIHLRLLECYDDEEEYCCGLINVLPPVGIDDCFWWPENQNAIAIESFEYCA